jgi:hypothetical protein
MMSYSVTLGNLDRAHESFRNYCIGVEAVWGGSFIKPNHHHLMHVKQCVKDYGPAHVFWVFAFERNNGLLANFHTSYRTIELEMMKRFIQQQMILNQDHSAIATIAIENSTQLQRQATTNTIMSMQSYTNRSLPLILQSEYNISWYQPNEDDPYPYPTRGSGMEGSPSEPVPSGENGAATLIWDTPPPFSLQVIPPCHSCAQLLDDISMIKTEDRAAAVSFMPSTPTLWREFKQ